MKISEPNIARHLKHFLLEYLTQQRGCSQHTVWSYRDALCCLLRYLQEMHGVTPNRIKVTDLSAENIMAFLNYLQETRNASDETRNQRLAAILLGVEPVDHGQCGRDVFLCIRSILVSPSVQGKRSFRWT